MGAHTLRDFNAKIDSDLIAKFLLVPCACYRDRRSELGEYLELLTLKFYKYMSRERTLPVYTRAIMALPTYGSRNLKMIVR